MPYKDKAQQLAAMRKINAGQRVKRRAAEKVVKEFVSSLLRDVGVFDCVKKDCVDGFDWLKCWLLPKFTRGLRDVRGDVMVFDSMVASFESGLGMNEHFLPELLARALSHVNGQFYLLSVWIRDLDDYMRDPDDFNHARMVASVKAFMDVAKGPNLPGVANPGLDALKDRVDKDGARKLWLAKQNVEAGKVE